MQRRATRSPIEQIASRWIVASDPDDAIAKIKPYVDAGLNHLVFHAPARTRSASSPLRGAGHAGVRAL
jgi:coenzyme F420-dependent glucose-6-phosphate dehydrogenase